MFIKLVSLFFVFSLTRSQHNFPMLKESLTTETYKVKEVLLTGMLSAITWTSTNVTNQFDYFDELTGEGIYELIFSFDLEPNSTMAHVNAAVIYLQDPKYFDKKMAILFLPLNGSFNEVTENWEGNVTSTVRLTYNLQYQGQKLQIPQTIFIINETYLSLSSKFFSFTAIAHPKKYQPLLPWIMLIPTIIMLTALHVVKITDIPAIKISLFTLFLNLNFLLFISLQQLYFGTMSINNPQGWLILTGTLTFSSVIRFIQSFQSVIRRINGVKGYLQFYIFTFIYLICLFNFGISAWFAVVNSLFLVPQIIHNSYEGIRPGFYLSYIIVIISSQFYMLYFKGCPENILSLSPSYGACIGILVSIILQITFLYLQHIFGSRFFIPKKWIPGYFNYIQQIEFDMTTRLIIDDCYICLLPLSQEPGTQLDFQESKKSQQNVESKVVKKVMKTPCNHRFHVKCLQTWMQRKLQCPVDRTILPPLE